MLLDQKYQPKCLDEIKFNQAAQLLSKLTLESMPHLIVHGKPGSGKRTLIYAFINHLFGKTPICHQRTIEITTSSDKKLDISYIESNEYVEICPSNYNFKDKDVMQTMIKNMAETKSISSLVSNKSSKLKLIVVTRAEKLSRDAQAALRRTVETYSSNFRIILVCNELNGIIEPIKSRMLSLSVKAPLDESILSELKKINKKESLNLSSVELRNILGSSNNNLRRAIFFLNNMLNMKKKTQNQTAFTFKLDYEEQIQEIITKMIKNDQSTSTILSIRSILNDLLVKCIPPRLIMKYLFKSLLKHIEMEDLKVLTELTMKYDGRIILGSKSIYHLEAYVIGIMTFLRLKK